MTGTETGAADLTAAPPQARKAKGHAAKAARIVEDLIAPRSYPRARVPLRPVGGKRNLSCVRTGYDRGDRQTLSVVMETLVLPVLA